MRQKAEQKPAPWNGEPTRRTNADAYFAPPGGAKTSHALESPAGKLGAIFVLLAISSVAAVGMFMPEEDTRPNASSSAVNGTSFVPQTVSAPGDAAQQAYALAYEMARQRVTSVGGLTRQERLLTGRQALAQILGGDIAHLDPAETTALAKQAPEPVKRAAFRGVKRGEALGISAQSQSLVERMLNRERHPAPEQTAP